MQQQEESKAVTVGVVIFLLFCGFPSLELTGFGFGFDMTLQFGLILALVGGAIGGVFMCHRPWIAGLVGA